MTYLFSVLFVLLQLGTSAQNQSNYLITKCSQVISSATSEWKSDSLGTTGYRAKYFHLLRQCKPDSITKQFLFDKLGKPSFIRKTAFGKPWKNHIEYVYFILNIDPKAKRKPYEGLYIAFVFDESESFLEEIIDGDFCG